MTEIKKIKEATLRLLKTSDPAKVSHITEAYLNENFQQFASAGQIVFGHNVIHNPAMGKYYFSSDANGALGCDEFHWYLDDNAYDISDTGRLCTALGAYEIYQFTRR